MKKRSLITVIGVLLLAASPFVVPVFSPWSRINCRLQEIDLVFARMRETRFVFWIPVLQKVTATSLSEVLSDDPAAAGDPRWEPVNTFGPYPRHSPYHSHHGAFSQIRNLELIWLEFRLDSASRTSTGLGLLNTWRQGGIRHADDYLGNLTQRGEALREAAVEGISN